jgi:hypothetical protein
MIAKIYSIGYSLLFLFSATGAQPKIVESAKEESWTTYRIVHPLHNIEATSKEALYKLEFDPANKVVKSVSAQVDVTTFDSGNSNRNSHAMEVIDAISYPDMTFSSSTITQFGDSLSVSGRLTFHGVTKDIVAGASVKWFPGKLEVLGGFNLSLTAFNIERPSLLMIPVQDTLRFSFGTAFSWK